MANRDADWVINTYDGVPLGQILVDERLRYLLIQSMVAKDSGVHQSSLSAYEHCRVTPSWDVFVRFGIDGGAVVLGVVREARPSVEVAFEGLMVDVAPFEELDLPAA